jgi:adenylosuccinate lyase
MERTQPLLLKEKGVKLETKDLVAGRYGTQEMVEIWGPEQTFDRALFVQAAAVRVLSDMDNEIVLPEHADEIAMNACLRSESNPNGIDPDRIRELEEKTGHDGIAINLALEERISEGARAHVNQLRTTADTTETARALQIKKSIEVIAVSVENLRDILIERSLEWIDIPHMDTSHLYDALPTVAGRPFAHYAEMLQSNLDFLRFVHDNSVKGKWGDATGNHHSANSMGLSGIALQKEYCDRLGIGSMIANAQTPGLEFLADVMYSLTRTSATVDNIARYIGYGRGDDTGIFIYTNPDRKKGSSAMPHKDAKGGNPTAEEQNVSIRNYLIGLMNTALINCEMPYARTLYASANLRIIFNDAFKVLDHGIRRLANVVYWLKVDEERCAERVDRSHGIVTAQQVMNYLTDARRMEGKPMGRSEAHNLVGKLATEACEKKRHFVDVVMNESRITSRLDRETIGNITDPFEYIGQSREIIQLVAAKYHSKGKDVF